MSKQHEPHADATVLYGAVARNDPRTVQALVDRSPSLLEAHFLDKSWFHWAAMLGRIEVMEVLANAGGAVDQPTSDGFQTPLDTAAGQGHVRACRWLLDRGANVNHGSGTSATPVFSAIFSKSLELVQLFVERGADLGATFGDPEKTVVSYSEAYGTPDITSFLRKLTLANDQA